MKNEDDFCKVFHAFFVFFVTFVVNNSLTSSDRPCL